MWSTLPAFAHYEVWTDMAFQLILVSLLLDCIYNFKLRQVQPDVYLTILSFPDYLLKLFAADL